jgi:hypothetical protein
MAPILHCDQVALVAAANPSFRREGFSIRLAQECAVETFPATQPLARGER